MDVADAEPARPRNPPAQFREASRAWGCLLRADHPRTEVISGPVTSRPAPHQRSHEMTYEGSAHGQPQDRVGGLPPAISRNSSAVSTRSDSRRSARRRDSAGVAAGAPDVGVKFMVDLPHGLRTNCWIPGHPASPITEPFDTNPWAGNAPHPTSKIDTLLEDGAYELLDGLVGIGVCTRRPGRPVAAEPRSGAHQFRCGGG